MLINSKQLQAVSFKLQAIAATKNREQGTQNFKPLDKER